MIAALLKHTNLLADALYAGTMLLTASAQDSATTISPSLDYVWRFTGRMRAWFMNKAQEMKKTVPEAR